MTGRNWIGIALVACVLPGCRTVGSKPGAGTNVIKEQKAGVAATPAVPSKRLVYPWSVVSGGVDSQSGMRWAMQHDPVVEAHYVGLNPTAFRAETLTARRKGYVSYRIRDKVYWTRSMVTLQAGETVLSDGQSMVRGRCGNLVSPTPRQPVAPVGVEPPEIAMDLAVREAQLMQSPALPADPVVKTELFYNPKQLAAERSETNALPPPDPQEMMPPVWTAGATSSPGGGIVGVGNAGGASPAQPATPVSPAPETPDIGAIFVPVPTPNPVEIAPPLVTMSLLLPPEAPVVALFPVPPNRPPEHPWTPNYPPGPPPVPYPPAENPPPSSPPPTTPPPSGPPPPEPPPSGPPPASPPPPPDPPLTPPHDPPPPERPIPEPGAWVFLALGLAGIAIGAVRRKT